MSRMPTLFIPHGGGPCFFMDWNPPDTWDRHRAYLEGLADTLEEKPKAIVVISGHWDEDVVTVQSSPAPGMLFDYYGFPPHTYELDYPAPGDPLLAGHIVELLSANHIPAKLDGKRGYDHGLFVPFLVAFPDADIPVIEVSMRSDLDPAFHMALGRALRPLRDEGVLIVGSGNTYHNLKEMLGRMRSGRSGPEKGAEFDAWLTDAVADPDPLERARKLAAWAEAPGAREAHPHEDHLLPLHVAAGAAGEDRGVRTFEDTVMGGVQSAYRFG